MPIPSDIAFWNVSKAKVPKHLIVFVGNQYASHSESQGVPFTRGRTLKAVASKFETTIVGGGWKKYKLKYQKPTQTYSQTREYYANAVVGLNIINDGYRKLRKCWSNRLTHMMLCGLAVFTPHMPYIDEVLKDGEHVILYNTDKDLLNKMFYYFEHRDKLDLIGQNAKTLAREIMDVDKAVHRILAIKRKN